jgi:DNA end-binding protein Ku
MEIDDSKSIEITRFVDASDVDPVYFDRTYYLAPARETAAQRPYVLLLRAMQETGKAALGRFVRGGSEHLCLIRPKGDSLALETMFLAEDVNSQAEIEEAVGGSKVKEPELDLARQVIDSLAGEFDPGELTSLYRQNLRQMLEAKLDGQEIVRAEPEAEETPVVDLMEALRRSVEEVKETKPGRKKTRAASKGGSRKRVAARKSA